MNASQMHYGFGALVIEPPGPSDEPALPPASLLLPPRPRAGAEFSFACASQVSRGHPGLHAANPAKQALHSVHRPFRFRQLESAHMTNRKTSMKMMSIATMALAGAFLALPAAAQDAEAA